MARSWDSFAGPAGALGVHVAPPATASGPPGAVVVLCHGFPLGADAAESTGDSLPALADRLAAESGRTVVAGCFRGIGPSAGDFSLDGWLEDLQAFVSYGADLVSGGGVWLVGFGTGGALALCLAAGDQRVRAVAAFGSPATFADWAQDVDGMLEFARRVGVVRSAGFPPDVTAWSRGFSTLRPDEACALLPPRPVLIVHGVRDEEVPLSDARVLADAVGATVELRVIGGAGHRLRADPRAMALLVGWLERQGP
ncbi:MAG TPA: alpha/beta fold hydrolase [Acidimicrobiales bacterium]|nr:alpha/beta fold hydrolase [Acidimicrobiales bacterium]